jgi:hypothetical protein
MLYVWNGGRDGFPTDEGQQAVFKLLRDQLPASIGTVLEVAALGIVQADMLQLVAVMVVMLACRANKDFACEGYELSSTDLDKLLHG